MSEKKATSGATAKKSAKKKSSTKSTKETNPADVRQKVSTMVKSKAMAMAEAVIGENEKGEVPKNLLLATVKYLFEVAIYPPQSDQDSATADEDCLAKTLLNRLNIPDEPIHRDEEEEEDRASVKKVSAETMQVESKAKDAGLKESGSESA